MLTACPLSMVVDSRSQSTLPIHWPQVDRSSKLQSFRLSLYHLLYWICLILEFKVANTTITKFVKHCSLQIMIFFSDSRFC